MLRNISSGGTILTADGVDPVSLISPPIRSVRGPYGKFDYVDLLIYIVSKQPYLFLYQVAANTSEEYQDVYQNKTSQLLPLQTTTSRPVAIPVSVENPTENHTMWHGVQPNPIPLLPVPTVNDFNVHTSSTLISTPRPSPLSLNLSLSLDLNQSLSDSQAFRSFKNGESAISVA